MAILDKSEILAYSKNNKIYCLKCAEDYLTNITVNELITKEDVDVADEYFCDLCEKQIT